MKRTQLLIAIATLPLVSACCEHSYPDPRPHYLNTDTPSGGSGSTGRTRVIVSEPQPIPIRVKPGTQPPRYQPSTPSSNAPTGSTSSQYDNSDPASTASPLRHDKPDQPLYKR